MSKKQSRVSVGTRFRLFLFIVLGFLASPARANTRVLNMRGNPPMPGSLSAHLDAADTQRLNQVLSAGIPELNNKLGMGSKGFVSSDVGIAILVETTTGTLHSNVWLFDIPLNARKDTVAGQRTVTRGSDTMRTTLMIGPRAVQLYALLNVAPVRAQDPNHPSLEYLQKSFEADGVAIHCMTRIDQPLLVISGVEINTTCQVLIRENGAMGNGPGAIPLPDSTVPTFPLGDPSRGAPKSSSTPPPVNPPSTAKPPVTTPVRRPAAAKATTAPQPAPYVPKANNGSVPKNAPHASSVHDLD